MARIERVGFAPLTPAIAQRLWVDTNRWPTFVDGFGHIVSLDDSWPGEGAKVVWESGPAGRGRVTERISTWGDGEVATQVFDKQMTAVQAARFEPNQDGSDVYLSLDYELSTGGPLRVLTDALFIRRALAMALERTLRRFSTEAGDEATL